MKILVFAKQYNIGVEYLTRMTYDVIIVNRMIGRYHCRMVSINDVVYEVVAANDNARGRRANIVHIQNGISEDIINTVIYPMIRPLEGFTSRDCVVFFD